MNASNNGGQTWISTDITMIPPSGNVVKSLNKEPGEWILMLELFEVIGTTAFIWGIYEITVTLGSGLATIPFFELDHRIHAISLTDVPPRYLPGILHFYIDGIAVSPQAGWNLQTHHTSLRIGINLGTGPAEISFRFYAPGGTERRASYIETINLVTGGVAIMSLVADFGAVPPPSPVTSITITGLLPEHHVAHSDADLFIMGVGAIDTEVLVTGGQVTFNVTNPLEPGIHNLQFEIYFPFPAGSMYIGAINLVSGSNEIPLSDFTLVHSLPRPAGAVSSVTVTDVGPYIGTEADFFVWAITGEGVSAAWHLLAGAEITGDSVTFPAGIPSGNWHLRLDFWRFDNGWALESRYMTLSTLSLGGGTNTIPLSILGNTIAAHSGGVPFGEVTDREMRPGIRAMMPPLQLILPPQQQPMQDLRLR